MRILSNHTPEVHIVHQFPFISERATITLGSINGNRIDSIRKKKEVKVKAYSYFGT